MTKSTVIALKILLMSSVLGQDVPTDGIPSDLLEVEHRGVENCDCMDYWACVSAGGQPYSYCGLEESSVCCLLSTGGQSVDNSGPKRQCGVKGFDSGRVGVAEPSEWPWHVAIVEEPGFFYVCGGSLIDEMWVLTAAHCVIPYTNNSTSLKVRLGEHDVSASTEALSHEDRNVSQILIHPQMNPTTLFNDIALLRLDSPAHRRHHIDVICLPEQQESTKTNQNCFLTGWGKSTENGSFSQLLKEVPIPIWDDRLCVGALKNQLGSAFNMSDTIFCAGAPNRDACDGDGGGPLVCEVDGQWFQHGIVSYGFGCGRSGAPGVYTKVSQYYTWIRQNALGK